jgi:hypothetical protein
VPFGPARNETPRPSLPAPVQSLPDPNGAAPYLIADPASPSTTMMYRGIQAKPVFRAPLARCKGPPSSSVCRWTGPPPRPPRAARFLTDPSVSAPVQRLDFQRAQGALPLRKLAAPFQDEPSPGQSFQGPVPRLSVGGLDGSIWVRDHDAHRYALPPAAARSPDGTWRPDEVRDFAAESVLSCYGGASSALRHRKEWRNAMNNPRFRIALNHNQTLINR